MAKRERDIDSLSEISHASPKGSHGGIYPIAVVTLCKSISLILPVCEPIGGMFIDQCNLVSGHPVGVVHATRCF